MVSSVVFLEFLVITFIFTATIIASKFAKRWLENIEKDNIQSDTDTSNFIVSETDYRSCDPHFLVVEETDKIVTEPSDSSSLKLSIDGMGETEPIALEESKSIETESSTLNDEDDNIIEEIEE